MQGLTLDLSQAVTSGSGNECKISVLILHTVVTDAQGAFRFAIPAEPLSLRVEGKNLDQIVGPYSASTSWKTVNGPALR